MFGRIPTQGRLVPHRQAQPIARSHASLRDLDFWQLQASKHQAEAIRLKKRLAELESENNILVSRSICLKDIECENVQLVNKAKIKERECGELRKRLASSRDVTRRVEHELDDTKSALKEIKRKFSTYRDNSSSSSSKELLAARRKIRDLREHNTLLLDDLKNLEKLRKLTPVPKPQESLSSTRKLSMVQRHKKSMQQLHAKLESANDKIASLERASLKSDSKIDAVREKHRATIQAERTKSSKLKEQLKNVARSLMDTTERLVHSENQVKELAENLEATRRRKEELQASLKVESDSRASFEAELEVVRDKLASTESSLKSSREQESNVRSALEHSKKALEESCQSVSKYIHNAKGDHATIERLQNDIKRCQDERCSLQAESDRKLVSMRKRLDSYQSQLTNERNANKEERAKAVLCQEKLLRISNERDTELANRLKEQRLADATEKQLRNRLNEALKNLESANMDIVRLRDEVSSLRSEMSDEEDRAQRLTKQVEELEKDRDRIKAELSEDIRQEQTRSKNLSRSLQNRENELKRKISLLKQEEETVRRIRENLKTAENDIANKDARLAKAEMQLSKAEMKLSEKTQALSSTEKMLDGLRNRCRNYWKARQSQMRTFESMQKYLRKINDVIVRCTFQRDPEKPALEELIEGVEGILRIIRPTGYSEKVLTDYIPPSPPRPVHNSVSTFLDGFEIKASESPFPIPPVVGDALFSFYRQRNKRKHRTTSSYRENRRRKQSRSRRWSFTLADGPDDEKSRKSPSSSAHTSSVGVMSSVVMTSQFLPSGSEASGSADDRWAQCDRCEKWRRLSPGTDVSKLPKLWYCNMNRWDKLHNSCSQPEDPSHYD